MIRSVSLPEVVFFFFFKLFLPSPDWFVNGIIQKSFLSFVLSIVVWGFIHSPAERFLPVWCSYIYEVTVNMYVTRCSALLPPLDIVGISKFHPFWLVFSDTSLQAWGFCFSGWVLKLNTSLVRCLFRSFAPNSPLFQLICLPTFEL